VQGGKEKTKSHRGVSLTSRGELGSLEKGKKMQRIKSRLLGPSEGRHKEKPKHEKVGKGPDE